MITKFKSRNLRGETRAEEKSKIIRERAKAIVAGALRDDVLKIGGWRAGLHGLGTSERNPLDEEGIEEIKENLRKFDFD